MPDDAFQAWRLRAAEAEILDVAQGAQVGAKLKKRSREWVGPCPACGGTDRFSVNPQRRVFNCRGAGGGDVIAMVMHACAVEFLAACELITGEPPPQRGSQITEETRRRAEQLKAEALARTARAEADFNAYRARERKTVFEIWNHAHPLAGSTAEQYLVLRGLTLPPTLEGRADRLRCVESMPFFVDKDTIIHRGPAMVAPIVDQERKFRGLHFTWLDLADPKGKARLEHKGEPFNAKKSRGSKQGNHIELLGPREPARLVLGEGIEKAIAVWMALSVSSPSNEDEKSDILESTAFWSAADLGNLGGKHKGTVAHPTLKSEKGRAVKVPSAVPDLEAPAIAVPNSVTDLVLLADSTSDRFTTQLAIARAAARYARPGRTVRVAWAPEGEDFDDLLRAARGDDATTAAALTRIAGIVDQAPAWSAAEHSEEPARRDESTAADPAAVRDGPGDALAAPGSADADKGPAPVAGAPNVIRPNMWRGRGVDSDSSAPSFSSASPDPSRGNSENSKTLANEEEGGPPPEEGPSGDDFRYCAGLDQSDVDNAKRLICYFGRDLLVRQEDDVPAGQMLAWTGTHWDLAGGEALAHMLGQKVGDLIKQEANYMDLTDAEVRAVQAGEKAAEELKALEGVEHGPGSKERIEPLLEKVLGAKRARGALSTRKTNRRKWGVSTKNRARISAMLECAAPHLRRHPDAFNADPLKVSTLTHTLHFVPEDDLEHPDGVRPLVDRATGRTVYRLHAKPGHDRDDMLTAVIPFAYDPKAECRDFMAFLDLFQPEPNKRQTIQAYSGMSLTAQPVQRIMYHTGTGGNGKSVFLEVMARTLGDGLAVGVPSETVSGQVQNNPSAPTPDVARCYAKRYLRIAELPPEAPLKGDTIKKLTGGERWPVRTMYKGYFEFKPTGKPHMSGNGIPKFDGADGGLQRRVLFVEWSVTLPTEKHRDFEDVVSAIVAGGSGILNWLIEGALDFLNNGLVIAEDVQALTKATFAEMDPCQRFIEAHVRTDPGGEGVTGRAMYEAYKIWCEVNGAAKMYETKFGLTMKKKLKRDDTRRVRVYLDVALHDVPESPSKHAEHGQPPPQDHDGDPRF